jgi:hypothetical protein
MARYGSGRYSNTNQVYRTESVPGVQEIDPEIIYIALDPAWQKQFPAA